MKAETDKIVMGEGLREIVETLGTIKVSILRTDVVSAMKEILTPQQKAELGELFTNVQNSRIDLTILREES